MKFILFFLLFLSLTPSFSQSGKEATKTPPLNVLFISVDDMNNDLGVFGNPQVQSPNIDRLAERGVAFERAYCQFPWCSPSRSSVMTGLRPDSTRVMDLQYHFRQGLPDIVTLPQMFMQNGYFVARVGKIYHYGNPGDIGTNSLDDRASWMERYNPAGLDKSSLEADVINYTPSRGIGSTMAWYNDQKGRDADHTDGKVAEEAIRLLAAHRDEPFFIAAGFYRPHCPWIAPSAYFDKYRLDEILLPKLQPDVREKYPAPALASTNPWPYFGATPEQARQSKLAYYASISFVDAQVGRLLDAIDSLGLGDNTIIVFWSDHGYHLGEHGLIFKHSLFEESAKAPLIFVVPGLSKNKASKHIVELLDIYPTLADVTGITAPGHLQGRSLAPLLKDPDAEWNHPAFTQTIRPGGPGYSLRTDQFRYTVWLDGSEGRELYDEIADPREEHNLAEDPAHREIVAQLDSLIRINHPRLATKGVADKDTREKFCD